MITSDAKKRYQAAQERFVKPALMNFFATEFPRIFGPVMRENIAQEIMRLFEAINPDTKRLQPGQILWNALDKNTRGDAPNRRFIPVVLTVIDEKDVQQLASGEKMSIIAQNSIARMLHEAYQQGALLSMRDLGLLTLSDGSTLSSKRKKYEQRNQCTLPHTGSLQDMGSSITHKKMIVSKVVLHKKDPAQVARETNHSQKAVDRYLNDFNRVRALYEREKDIDYIHLVTGMAKHVVKQYIQLILEVNEKN